MGKNDLGERGCWSPIEVGAVDVSKLLDRHYWKWRLYLNWKSGNSFVSGFPIDVNGTTFIKELSFAVPITKRNILTNIGIITHENYIVHNHLLDVTSHVIPGDTFRFTYTLNLLGSVSIGEEPYMVIINELEP